MQRLRRILIVAAVVALVTTGCGDDDETSQDGDTGSDTSTASTPEDTSTDSTGGGETTTTAGARVEAQDLALTAGDFSYDSGGVTSVEAGLITVSLTNEGAVDHQATVVRLRDGKTTEDLMAMTDPAELAEIIQTFGGPNGVLPGASVVSTVRVTEPGSYMVMCFIPDPADGQAHAAKGQILPLEVTEPTAPLPAEVALPDAPETVGLDDYSFDVPAGFTGEGSVLIENTGAEAHELAAIKVADGATAEDAIAFLTADPAAGPPPEGPPPFAGATGVSPMDAGEANVVELDLTPGDWVFICYLPTAGSGAPHFTEGMVQTVTVT